MTDSDKSSTPDWINQQPSAFDIVAGYFPESKPKGDLRLRPCLVLNVLKGTSSGSIACKVAFGTKNLKIVQRKNRDLIIQNSTHLNEIGLPLATRFDLDERNLVILPWTEEFFGCWTGYKHPKIGALLEVYIKDYAYCMMLRENERT